MTGTRVALEGSADSKLGTVALAGDLTVEGNAMSGAGTVAIGNQKVPVISSCSAGRAGTCCSTRCRSGSITSWVAGNSSTLGGEFPPLSTGERTGSVTFSAPSPSQFVNGTVEGEILGKPFRETVTVGVNPDTKMVVFHERRADGVELVSLGNWTSPLAIVFQTAPVQSGGRAYQLRRVLSVLSDVVRRDGRVLRADGGAFRRLGSAHYTKLP